MREETLRAVLMVKAIEEVDRDGIIIPPGDRTQATREALRETGTGTGERAPEPDDRMLAGALAARALRLAGPLARRFPIVDEALTRTRVPAGLLLAAMALAVTMGIALSALDGARRINILAFPFLGLILWNFVTYLFLGVTWARAHLRGRTPSRARGTWVATYFRRRMAPLLRRTRPVHVLLGEALAGYAADCARTGAPFVAQQLRRALHLAAAMLALGLVAGLYLRGTVLRYEAGWESTFLGPAQVQAVLGVLFGPVAGWSGVPLPQNTDEVEALRWTADGGGGDAAPWIHLIALCLGLYVVLPRLLLAGAATLSLARATRATRLPALLRGYAADTLRGGDVAPGAGTAAVTPYAYEASEASLAGLARWLPSAVAGVVRCERRPMLRYGEEDTAATALAIDEPRSAGLHVVLMNLAATPESENHGIVIAAARDAAHRARPPASLRIVVDESPYEARFATDASLAARLDERRRLWRNFVAGYGLEADLLRLEQIARAEPREGQAAAPVLPLHPPS